jgi:hypothetical protein
MFLQFPFQFSARLQHTVLILNTVLLVAILIFVELIYSETSKESRKHLRYFYPLIAALIVILIYAAYLQIGNS